MHETTLASQYRCAITSIVSCYAQFYKLLITLTLVFFSYRITPQFVLDMPSSRSSESVNIRQETVSPE